MRIPALSLAAALSLASLVQAEEIQVGDKTFSIVPPDGYCAFNSQNPADAFVIDAIQKPQAGMNQVLMVFALCTELEDWHAGRSPGYRHYGTTTVQLKDGAPNAVPISRRDLISAMESHMPKLDIAEIEKEIDAKTEGVDVSGSQLLGVIGKDANALYIGLLSNVTGGGQQATMAGVTSFTLLRSVIANTNLYEPAEAGAHDKLLSIQKTYLAELVRRNP